LFSAQVVHMLIGLKEIQMKFWCNQDVLFYKYNATEVLLFGMATSLIKQVHINYITYNGAGPLIFHPLWLVAHFVDLTLPMA